ncbi:MAG TPA: FAD-dependent oxidoreductase [Clostridia bacterium]|nr:FAD-dependent oxidoreductase [Clostridia bacterium]
MYDTIIIGSGLAGLTASIYASRYRLSNVILGKLLGGTITLAHKVENFPGFAGISGIELAQKVIKQAKALGAEILPEQVSRVEISGNSFLVLTESEKKFQAKTLIATTGTERRKLGVAGEKEYLGKGVSYCTQCDAAFFKGKTVGLVGGSDAAVAGALHTADFAQRVYIIYRREKLRAEPLLVKKALAHPKIEVVYNSNVTEILGDGNKVTGVGLDQAYKNSEELAVDGLFIEIGGVPVTNYLVPLKVELDEDGYVKVNPQMETNVAGVFAAGDLTTQSRILQQAITAAAQGAMAASSAFRYLKKR